MNIISMEEELNRSKYHGRGIVLGKSRNGKSAVIIYFIMGRSENSRNRIFIEDGDELIIKAYDEAKLEDPALIIYSPIKLFDKKLIVGNGDQTQTIFKGLRDGKSLEKSLEERKFEPDAPIFTPRISGLLSLEDDKVRGELSILKSDAGDSEQCLRFNYVYENIKNGTGFFIHTYKDGTGILESFEGEPKKIIIEDDIDSFSKNIWDNLNIDNKIALFVRYIDIESKKTDTRIFNKLCE